MRRILSSYAGTKSLSIGKTEYVMGDVGFGSQEAYGSLDK